MERDLTLREALAADRLNDFVRQEEATGAELVKGSELERALALLVTQHRRAGYRYSNPRAARMQLDKAPTSCEPKHPANASLMSEMGHEPTSRHVRVMSVIPLKPDIHQRALHVR